MDQQLKNTQQSYDQVADEYTSRIYHELQHKPLDCEILERFASLIHAPGTVYEMGCGPGHITRYLKDQGLTIHGLDLSSRMIDQARTLNSDIDFQQGDMTALALPNNSLAGIVAYYSLIHIPRDQIVSVLQEFHRVLQPHGRLLLTFHRGQEVRHLETWWDRPVMLDTTFFEHDEMKQYLQQAHFTIVENIERAPYPDIELQTHRIYIHAQK